MVTEPAFFRGARRWHLPTFRGLKHFKEVDWESAPANPRAEEIYQAPLLLIPQTPRENRSTPKAFLSRKQSFCYNQSIYGCTGGRHPDPETHLSLLHLIAHSQLFRYWRLVTSSRIGASWRTFIKEDLDAFPFPDVAEITEAQRLATFPLKIPHLNRLFPWPRCVAVC